MRACAALHASQLLVTPRKRFQARFKLEPGTPLWNLFYLFAYRCRITDEPKNFWLIASGTQPIRGGLSMTKRRLSGLAWMNLLTVQPRASFKVTSRAGMPWWVARVTVVPGRRTVAKRSK